MPESIRRPEGQIPMSPSVRVMTGMGPSSEDLNRFRGPGEVIPQITDIQRAQTSGQPEIFQPTSKANLPQIEMMAGKGGRGKEPDEEKKQLTAEEELMQRNRREAMLGEGRGGHIYRLVGNLQQLDEEKKKIDKLTARTVRMTKHLQDPSKKPSDVAPIFHGEDFKLSLEELEKARNELQLEFEKLAPNDKRRKGVEKQLAFLKETLEITPEELEENVENIRKSIRKQYDLVKHNTLDEMSALNKYLEHFRNPYPYDSRYTINSLQQYLEVVNDLLRSPENLDEEGLAFATMLKRDLLWSISASTVIESMGPALENFFDGEMVIQKQRGPHTDILAEDYIRFLAKEIDGLEPSQAQRELIEKTLGKEKGDKLGLREKAVEFQDSYGIVLYNLVAAGQKNLELGWNEDSETAEAGERYAILTETQYQFFRAVFNMDTVYDPHEFMEFDKDGKLIIKDAAKKDDLQSKTTNSMVYKDKNGNKYAVHGALINPFCMDKSDEIAVRAAKARMHVLVQNFQKYFGDNGEFQKIENTGAAPEAKKRSIEELAKKIIDEADERIMKWEQTDSRDTDFRLTDTVIRSLNNLETGIYATGDLGWGWRYSQKQLLNEAGPVYKLNKSGAAIRDAEGKPVIEIVAKTPFIEINGERIYKGDTRYSTEFWNFVGKNLVFKPNSLGVDGELFWVKKDTSGNFQKAKIEDCGFQISEAEIEALKSIAIHTFEDTDEVQRNNPDLKRIQEDPVDHHLFIVKRKSELGSIYETSDITTIVFWARHNIDYDTTAYSRSTMFFPSIGWYRERWAEQPPYWRPTLEEFASRDHALMRSLGLEDGSNGILSKNNVFKDKVGRKYFALGKKGLQMAKYGEFNKKSASFIRNNVWAFVTPWSNSPGSGAADEYDLVMPVFLPTALTDLSLWRSVTLASRAGKVSDNPGGTIWHERLRGQKFSELNWKNMDVNKNSRFVNTGDQLERWLGPLITPHVFNRMTAGEVEKFYNSPGGLAEKEGGKRAGLSLSGNRVEDGVIRSTVFAQNKVFASVYVMKVMGKAGEVVEKAKLKRELTLDNTVLQQELDRWRAQTISEWVNTYLDLPGTVKGIDNYPGTAAMSMIVSYIQARRIVASAIVNSSGQGSEVNDSIAEIEKMFQ